MTRASVANPAPRSKRDVVTEFRHAEILAAARRVFARRGFAEASMDEISQGAGLAKGTLYLYYPSKRELYRAALRGGLIELCLSLERRLAAEGSLAARIRAYVATKVSYFEEHRDFFRIYFAEFGNATTGTPDREFRDLCLRQIRLLERVVEQGAKAGAVARPPARAAAYAIFDLTRGVILRRLLGWSSEPAASDVSFVADFAVRALGGR